MKTDRRALLALGGAFAALAPFLALGDALAQANDPHADLMAIPDLRMHGQERIAMLMFPGFTALDLVGPHYMFACMMGAQVDLVTTGPDLSPVASDLGLAIAPTTTLAQAPADLDILFAPGGTQGLIAAMRDPEIVAFIRDRGARARHVTSVCTGSLLLAQAGLLRGKRATSHWAARPLLSAFGALPSEARVVTDGNVTTGAGVSAGIDFGLALVAALRGANYARALQLQAEYAPEPPFDAGAISTAPRDIAAAMSGMFEPFREQIRAVAAAGITPGATSPARPR